MTTNEVLRRNIRDAERGLEFLDYANGVIVVRHALESILKRCSYAIEGILEEEDEPFNHRSDRIQGP